MATRWVLPTIVAVLLLLAGPAQALGPFTLGLEADYVSRYIWRGYDVPGNNHSAFQPSATVAYSPIDDLALWGNVWANYQIAERDSDNEWDEVDYTVALDYTVTEVVSVSLGHIFYHFPKVGHSDLNDTKEVYGGVGVDLPHNLSSQLTVYYDYDNGKGIYANLALEYSRDLSDVLSVSAGANVGYMNYNEDEEDDGFYVDEDGEAFDGFSDANFSLGLSVDVGHGFSVWNNVVYTIPLDDAINDDQELWTLTAVSVEI